MIKDNVIAEKSKELALQSIALYKYLADVKHEFVLSKQLLRSGTSVGANVREALRGQSRPDFFSKLNIALKEADETEYWLELLHESGYLESESYNSIYSSCEEVLSLLVSITKTQKNELR